MQSNQTTKTDNATCPACGMLCDDINVSNISANTCEKSISFFSQPCNKTTPEMAGKAVSLNEAIAHAAELLKTAKRPLIGGLSTDLAGFRSAYQLAGKSQASIAHMNATTTWRNVKVLQSTGWQTTTLTEVRNRADVVLCIGTDVVKHNPRFFERIIWPEEAMFVDNEDRDIIYLGAAHPDRSHGVSPAGKLPMVLTCDSTLLPEVTAALHALVANKPIAAKQVAGIDLSNLADVAERLKQAKYATLIWVAKDLDFPHAELTIQQITQTVVELNKTTRAGALAMGGSDGDTTANYAHTWLTGLAINEEALPAHDTLIWVNSFSPEKTIPDTDAPTIVLGNPNLKPEKTPDVFIPVATPGLDCAGTLFRVDSSVVMPLKQVRETNLPTLSEVMQQIEGAL